jgi:TRAP-type mannitol/chloroaromatic compound transport system permease small subunit
MRALLYLSFQIDRVNRFVGRAMLWLLLASVFISAGNAISRKFFSLSSNGMLEVQWHLFAIAFLGCGAYVLMVDEHVRIDVLSRRWSARTRAWVDIAALALVALPLAALMGVYGWTIFLHAFAIGEASFNAGGLLVAPLYLCIPISMGLLGLQAISELIRRIGFLLGLLPQATLGETDLPPLRPLPASESG